MVNQLSTASQRLVFFIGLMLIMITLVVLALMSSTRIVRSETTQTITVGESPDFATLVLQQPWNMDDYDQISQYLNESGQRRLVRDVNVSNGIFSGVSIGTAADGHNAYFFPLFTGYETTMYVGKVGHNYPIHSSDYSCLYFAMKVDSGPANQMGPDQFVVYWFEDSRLVQRGGLYGVTGGIPLYPEAGAAQPAQGWRLYRVDLSNPQHGLRPDSKAGWDDRPLWRGIRIDPTINRDVKFAVDWVRLTSCEPNTRTVSWSPNAAGTALWLKAQNTEHFVRVATGINGASGSHALDVQGITPGRYTVALGTDTTCCVRGDIGTLQILPAPTIEFERPSFTSGQDYYTTQTGKPWDFERAGDVKEVRNVSDWRLQNNQLHLYTPSGPLPAGVDAQVYLDTPAPLNTGEYRFLTYRMYSEWVSPWQDVTSGMISRWIWSSASLTRQPGYECHLVTQDVPFNVGWHTYTVDLHDWFQGSPEDQYPVGAPHCPPLPQVPDQPPTTISSNAAHWLNTGPVHQLRMNPNENVSCDFGAHMNPVVPCSPYYQILDWVRLTKIDSVNQGQLYPVQFSLDRVNENQVEYSYFYTTDSSNPRQHQAKVGRPRQGEIVHDSAAASNDTLNAPANSIFMPLTGFAVEEGDEPPVNPDPIGPGNQPAQADFWWDTTGVTRGTYYFCVEAKTSYGTAIHCSDAPMQVK